MGGLGVLPSFGLADLRKKSKPMCTESGNPGSRSEWGLWFGTHGSKFLDGAFDLLPIESLKGGHLRALAPSLVTLCFQHLLFSEM